MSPSLWQILIVVGVVLLLFGPSRIAPLGKSLGQAIRGFKKGISGEDEVDVTDSSRAEQLKDQDGEKSSQTTEQEKDRV